MSLGPRKVLIYGPITAGALTAALTDAPCVLIGALTQSMGS